MLSSMSAELALQVLLLKREGGREGGGEGGRGGREGGVRKRCTLVRLLTVMSLLCHCYVSI